MAGVAADGSQSLVWRALVLRAAKSVLLWGGLASGVVLTVLTAAAWFAPGRGHAVFAVLIILNILMLIPWVWRALPNWLYATLAVVRGFHWAVNIGLASLGLLMLLHASAPRRALAFAVVSMMFLLWASAARKVTLAVHCRQD